MNHMHPTESTAYLLVVTLLDKLLQTICGDYDGDIVVTLRVTEPEQFAGDPEMLLMFGHGFPWWLRCDDETAEQFRRRAAAEALQRPRLPVRFGHVRLLAELPVAPEDARERLARQGKAAEVQP
ncbi:MAG: hypothetical protein QM750_11940 [Rubrivivax sp.]